MGEHSKHHETISESLGIENEIIMPEKTDTSIVKRKTVNADPMLFDTEEPEKEQPQQVVIIPEEESVRDAKKDYREARGRLHQVAEAGSQLLEGIMAVAEESEHPRAYEVATQLIKALSENTKQLMELHHDTHDLEDKKNKRHEPKPGIVPSKETSGGTTTNQSIFVGSTAELQKMLDHMSGK